MNKSIKTLFEEHSSKTLPKEDSYVVESQTQAQSKCPVAPILRPFASIMNQVWWKKSQWKRGTIKNGHSEDGSFHTRKSGNYNSLRGNLYYNSVTSKLIEEEIQCQNKVL